MRPWRGGTGSQVYCELDVPGGLQGIAGQFPSAGHGLNIIEKEKGGVDMHRQIEGCSFGNWLVIHVVSETAQKHRPILHASGDITRKRRDDVRFRTASRDSRLIEPSRNQ
jgi:hypothetical protein